MMPYSYITYIYVYNVMEVALTLEVKYSRVIIYVYWTNSYLVFSTVYLRCINV